MKNKVDVAHINATIAGTNSVSAFVRMATVSDAEILRDALLDQI
jgi:hypothetical protein